LRVWDSLFLIMDTSTLMARELHLLTAPLVIKVSDVKGFVPGSLALITDVSEVELIEE
ncbi:MAG: hypothetical protein AMDU1_APLC00034G0003, partial [Thermoplasmatales archaeon A-plasma]